MSEQDMNNVTEEITEEVKEDEYEQICYMCRRPESVAGKMIQIPGNICICQDCMQRTFDTMNSAPFSMDDMMNMSKMPNISMINLSDLQGFMPQQQKIKKKKKEKKEKPVLDIHAIPAPHKIKASLDEHVVGQEHAKKVMSVAVYNHYKRVMSDVNDGIEIEKSNMLMIGPTGSGKTYMVKTLARLLDVPLAITDATSLTEAGYIGDDIESVVSKLLAAADNDVERAEQGIIFIDEIDKIAKKKNTNQRDVSGESVQQGMLKLLEGAEVEVPVGASSKNAMVPMVTVNTKNILFICGGAFPDLEEIIKERLNKAASIGFKADLKDKYDKEENLLSKVQVEDIRKYGMIPEFLGRLPIIFSLEALTEEMLVRILVEPKNAITKQYQKLLGMDEVKLEFQQEALEAIAKKAKEKKVGARALRAIIEEFMLDIMYEIPKDDNIGMVTVTEAYVEGTGGPMITMRGCLELEAKS
ncbi:MAG: ATP-dependent Clp protease ATP-binding subunit ClpX [Lachnospiraceae bacterium]|nr:ATP-dependent Clp protease ATP-binding subunit ClpX [Lachnospiraceae bacterium]